MSKAAQLAQKLHTPFSLSPTFSSAAVWLLWHYSKPISLDSNWDVGGHFYEILSNYVCTVYSIHCTVHCCHKSQLWHRIIRTLFSCFLIFRQIQQNIWDGQISFPLSSTQEAKFWEAAVQALRIQFLLRLENTSIVQHSPIWWNFLMNPKGLFFFIVRLLRRGDDPYN